MADRPLPRGTIHLKTRLPLGLVALLALLQLVSPHRTWVVLMCAVLGALAGACLWSRSLACGVRVLRSERYTIAQLGCWLPARLWMLSVLTARA